MSAASPSCTSAPKVVVYLVDSWGAVAWYRCHTPGMALKARGHITVLTDKVDPRWVETCDVMVLQRAFQPHALDLIEAVKSRGGMTVYDSDDDYWTLHPENPVFQFWTAERLAGLAGVIKAVDVVTTTTPELAETFTPMNRNVRVLPNMLPDEHWPATPKQTPADGERLVIGWAGSASHKPDVRMIGPALAQILDEFPHVDLELVGARPEWVPPHPRITFPEFVPVDEYANIIARFDIGLAPLVDNKFNRCKSDLKFLEYSIFGIPSVVSRVLPYSQSVAHGENGYLAVNTKDWFKYLRALVQDRGLRESIGTQARTFAEERLVSRNVRLWEEAYGIAD